MCCTYVTVPTHLPIVRRFQFAHVVRLFLLDLDLPPDPVHGRVHGLQGSVHFLLIRLCLHNTYKCEVV